MRSNVCYCCHRVLTNPKSVEAGIGPICAAKARGEDAMDDQDFGMRVDIPLDPETMDIICYREESPNWGRGIIHVNVPHTVHKHSRDGYEWNYMGSGPAEFALNILALFIGPKRAEAGGFYQRFKEEFIAPMPMEGGTIPGDEIRAWIAANEVQQGDLFEDEEE